MTVPFEKRRGLEFYLESEEAGRFTRIMRCMVRWNSGFIEMDRFEYPNETHPNTLISLAGSTFGEALLIHLHERGKI